MKRIILATLVLAIACSKASEPVASKEAAKSPVSEPAVISVHPSETPPPLVQAPQPPPPPAPPPPAQEQVELGSPDVLSVSRCELAGCELVFTFPQPLQQLPKVTFKPPQKGELSQRSPNQVVFTPAQGALNWGHSMIATVEAPQLDKPWRTRISVPYFTAAGKVASWPVIEGKPRVIGTLPGDVTQLGSGPLLLLYDQPVEPKKLAKMISVQDRSGRGLNVKVSRPSSAAPAFEGELNVAHLIAVSVLDSLPEGESVVVRYPSWDSDEAVDNNLPLQIHRDFSLQPLALAEGTRMPLSAQWAMQFTSNVRTEALQRALKLTPEPKSLSVYSYGTEASVSAQLEPGVRYRMTLDRNLMDTLGNKLGKTADFKFQAEDLEPRLVTPQGPLLVERGRALLPLKTLNVGRVTASARRFDSVEAWIHAYRNPEELACNQASLAVNVLPTPSVRSKADLNQEDTLDLPLPAPKRGLLCVTVTGAGRGSHGKDAALERHALAQVSDLGLTAKVFSGGVLVWTTRLQDAGSVEGAKVQLMDAEGKVLSRATTDAQGVAVLAAKGAATGAGVKDQLFVSAQTAEDFTVAELSEERLSQAWQFGMSGEVEGAQPLSASVFTDRGAYRPDETVHVKAIVAEASRLPAAERSVQISLRDPRGQQVTEKKVTLDAFGAANLDVKLKPQAAVGEYTLRVSRGERFTARRFRVEEYRVPTFEVTVKSEQQTWTRGADLAARIEARYLHGGNLAGREARWEVLRDREVFAPASFPGYAFTLADAAAPVGSVASGTGRLNGDSQLNLTFKADHPSHVGPMRYVVEASVTDVDRQVYAGRISKVVHPAAFYVGMLPPAQRVLSAGATLEVPIVAVKPDGQSLEGVEVRAQLERIDFHTTARLALTSGVQLMNHPVKVDAGDCLVKTAKAPVTCRFKLVEAGNFQVRAWAEDTSHQTVQAGFPVMVSGGNAVAWPRFDQDRIELVADKQSYRPGDVAHLVVQTPFPKARGLLTLERGSVIEHRLFEINGDTPALDVPITDGSVPNIFASVVLLRGRMHDERDATGFETGAPAFKLGYANLKVDPASQRLAVGVKTASSNANPKTPLQIDLSLRDAEGKPTAGQLTVMVVDEAVLGLTGYTTPDPVVELFAPRPLGVRTAESRLELPNARRARHEQIFPGGDGGDGFSMKVLPSDLRSLFKSTAYWNPAVSVDETGNTRVTVDLPDNLTTYRIMAVAVDARGRAGSGDRKVVVKKPLMVQPVLPRFAYPGDQLRVEALAFNGTNNAGKVQVSASFEGLDGGKGALVQEREIPAGGSATFSFPVTVIGRKEAVVRFGAKLGERSDAVEVKLPVLNPGSKRTVVASAQVTGDGNVSVKLPPDREPGTAHAEVVVSTTMLSELKDAVQYLMGYPNGCIEQTTSTAYPLVVLKDLLPEIGITVSDADLKKFSEAGVKRLLSFQTSKGGLAYWPGSDQPHAFGTAFGLTALIEAKKRGYDVPDDALKRMGDFLEQSLRQGTISEEMPHASMADADTRALFVMTLGRLGRPQPAYVSALWREKDKLTPFGLSFLATAVQESNGDKSLLQPMLAAIRAAAKEAPSEAWFDGQQKGGWSMDSPLRTHAGALLAFADSGTERDVGNKLLAGLLKRRTYGMWGNTQENVFGIMGVARMVGSPSAGGSAPKMELTFEDRRITPDKMEAVSQRVRRLSAEESELALERGQEKVLSAKLKNLGAGPMFLTLRAQYDVALDPKNRAPRANGFEVSRSYETVEGQPLDGKPIPLGSVVRVRLKVKASEKHNYVALDDKLPAGLEPMNANLATTEKVSQGAVTPELERSLALLSHSEIRDARVAFYIDEMPAGSYEYTYLARATTPGHFLRPASGVEAMYSPEISGSSAIDEVDVR